MGVVDQVVTNTHSDLSKRAKEDLVSLVSKVDDRLKVFFDKEIQNPFGQSEVIREMSKKIWEHMREHNLRPAKRLRASFIYYGYKLFGGDNEDVALDASMSIELIHTGLLMHDDFMDQDEIRRGEPTTHKYFEKWHKDNSWSSDAKLYGESMAVNVGDMALLAGYEVLNDLSIEDNNRRNAMRKLLRGVINTGIGQAYDVTLQAIGVAKDEDIINLHVGKTGIYTYETPLMVGALLAGAKLEDLDLLHEYSMAGGVAFQIQDDILGIFGKPEVTGKSDNSDLKQKKVTLLSSYVLNNANEMDKKRFLELWGKRDLSENEAALCREIIVRSGSLQYSRDMAGKMAQKALEVVPSMRQKGLNHEAISYLEGIALYMVERDL
jgi:geranylgeranyl diphosphate synthase, type I